MVYNQLDRPIMSDNYKHFQSSPKTHLFRLAFDM